MATVKRDKAWQSVHVLDRDFDSDQQLDLYELTQAGLRIVSERELAQHYYAARNDE